MGTKRASPGAEDEKSPLQIAEFNENAKKLEEIQRDLARAELVLGKAFGTYEGRVFD
jgi:template-activating factor I